MRRRKQLLEHMPRNLFELLSVFGVSEVKKNKAKKNSVTIMMTTCAETQHFARNIVYRAPGGQEPPLPLGRDVADDPMLVMFVLHTSPSLKRGGTRSLLRLKPEAQYLLCICIPRELPSPGVNEGQACLIQRDTVEFSNPNHLHLTGWCV